MSRKEKDNRQCCWCHTCKDKKDLIRITFDKKNNSVILNNETKAAGRSVYICKNIQCIENAIKKRKLEGSLKVQIPEIVKEELYTVLKK